MISQSINYDLAIDQLEWEGKPRKKREHPRKERESPRNQEEIVSSGRPDASDGGDRRHHRTRVARSSSCLRGLLLSPEEIAAKQIEVRSSPPGGESAPGALDSPTMSLDSIGCALDTLVQTVQLLRDSLIASKATQLTKKSNVLGEGDRCGTNGGTDNRAFKEVLLSNLPGPQNNTGGVKQVKIREAISKKIQSIRSGKRLTCFRCGSLGHFVRECRDPELCFRCGRLGHRSWQCRATVGPAPAVDNRIPAPPEQNPSIKEHSIVTQPLSNLDSLSPLDLEKSMVRIKKFNSSPASRELEAAFKRSLFLTNPEGWGRERFLEVLRGMVPFN